ncbi:MAG: hypothetical protein GXX84_11785 [Acidobacteria bacterium]|nr:hypothetical protein [Acidobacteriota bacterium]
MKRILIGLLLLASTGAAQAADITFAWDPAPPGQNWEKVRLYERTGNPGAYVYTLKGEVAGTLTTMTITGVTPGAHTYVARSYAGGWESVDSNEVNTGPVPSSPSGIKITVIVDVRQQ